MDNKYSVDDILEEIKRKKMSKQGIDSTNSTNSDKQTSVQSTSYNYDYTRKPLPKYEENITHPQEKQSYEYTKPINNDFFSKNQIDDDVVETSKKEPSRPVGSSLAELMEKEFVTTDNKEYFQGSSLKEEQIKTIKNPGLSGRIAGSFGDEAFKPYENKASENLQKKHQKKFGFSSKKENPSIEDDLIKEYVPKKSQPIEQEKEDRKVIELPKFKNHSHIDDEPTKPIQEPPFKKSSQSETSEPADKVFKVNLQDNFFDENDMEHSSMDIKVKNMDSSKAAKGFTRNMIAFNSGEDEHKRKLFAFNEKDDEKDGIDDYTSKTDTAAIAKDVKSTKINILIKIVLMLITFGFSLYWGLSYDNTAFPLPKFMLPEENLQIFLAMCLGATVISALICSTTVGGGLISLFTLKPDSDSPIALATIVAIAQGVTIVILPEKLATGTVHVYFTIVVFGLLCNLIGKLLMSTRIERNFSVVSNEKEKFSVILLKNKNLAKELTIGQNLENPTVGISCKTDFPTGFLQTSYTEDYNETINKIITPLFLIFSLILTVVSWVLNKDVFTALTVFTAMMCICAPITTTLIGNLPLARIAKKLTKRDSVVSGYKTLEEYDDITTITVDANELIEGGTVILHGIKAFSEERIDEAIIDAASVSCTISGLLMDIFMEMIGNKQSLLKPVDNPVYEDGMGISAWVDNKLVLIGNRDLLINHGINAPEVTYEAKFRHDGREIVYLANSGKLTAMFVISYKGSEEMTSYLDLLAKKGVSISVYTTDPNITAKKIESMFDYPEELVTIMSSKVHADFNAAACDREKAPAKIIYGGSLIAKIMAICAVISCKSSIVLGTILQLVGIVLGYGIIAFCAFAGKMDLLSFKMILSYQAMWGFIVLLIPNLKKY